MATDQRGFSGKLADPEVRRKRGRKAARARTTLDHHIQKVAESAPSLSAEQAERLRSLLPAPSDDSREVA